MKKSSHNKLYLLCINQDLKKILCPKCKVEINVGSFSLYIGKTDSHMRYRTFLKPYQCQGCGEIDFSDQDINLPGEEKKIKQGTCVALKERCKCGGQYRRDKNIFCPNCKFRKNKNNRSQNNFHIYKKTKNKLFAVHAKLIKN